MNEAVQNALATVELYLQDLKQLSLDAASVPIGQRKGLMNVIVDTERNLKALQVAVSTDDTRRVVMALLGLPGDSRMFDYAGNFDPRSIPSTAQRYRAAAVAVADALEFFRPRFDQIFA